jgi:hypothetical protein
MKLMAGNKGFLLKISQSRVSDHSGKWNVHNILIFVIPPFNRSNEHEL